MKIVLTRTNILTSYTQMRSVIAEYMRRFRTKRKKYIDYDVFKLEPKQSYYFNDSMFNCIEKEGGDNVNNNFIKYEDDQLLDDI